MAKYLAYCDGGCFSNGKSGARAYGSFAVYEATDEQYEAVATGTPELRDAAHRMIKDDAKLVVHQKLEFRVREGERATNNYAEMSAVFTLLSYLSSTKMLGKENTVRIFMDSELVLKQLKKQYKVKNEALRRIYTSITNLVKTVVDEEGCNLSAMVELVWVPGTLMKETILEH